MRIRKTSQYIEGGAGLPSYFTTETNTGMKWIDGKDIYRKVIETTTPSTTSVASVASIPNLDKMINLNGMLTYGNQQVPLMLSYSTTVLNAIMVEGTNINVKISANAYLSCNCFIIAEYTKN